MHFTQLSKTITSEEGKKLGLIDAIVSPNELLSVARKWALDIADRRKPWIRTLHRTDKIGSLAEARVVLKSAREQAKRIAPNTPQHLACIDVIEEGIVHGGYSGVLKVPFILDSAYAVIRCIFLCASVNLFHCTSFFLAETSGLLLAGGYVTNLRVIVAGGKSIQGTCSNRHIKRSCSRLFFPAFDIKGTSFMQETT